MGAITNWIEEAQEISIFKGGGGLGAGIAGKPLLEISPTNRIVGVKFARLAIATRILALHLGTNYGTNYAFLNRIVDIAEEYQLTIGDNKNSREAYLESIKAQFAHYIRSDSTGTKRGVLGV